MNLLVITNNPTRASFRQRIGIYIEPLKQQGISGTVAQLPRDPFVRWHLFKTAAAFDAVFLQKKRLNWLDAIVLRHYARKIVYDFDDAVMYSDNRPDRISWGRQRSFRRTVALADVVIAGNKYLAEHARIINSTVHILPTGLDVAEYAAKVARPGDGKIRLVWIGSRATLGYLADIKPAIEQTGRLFKNVVLRIIGDEFFNLAGMQVEKRLWSQQRQASDLGECDIGLAPLADNPFTKGKCGFKILQYAAAGLPIVASPVGVNAEIIRAGTDGLLASSAADWVQKLSQLIQNPALRAQMGTAAGQMAHRFDSKFVQRGLAEIVLRLVRRVT